MSMLRTILAVSEVFVASKPFLSDGVAMMKPEEDFEVVHLMMERGKMEALILTVLNEQYLGDDNDKVPQMITDLLLKEDTTPPEEPEERKGCWHT